MSDINEKTLEKVMSLLKTISPNLNRAADIAHIGNKRIQASIKLNKKAFVAGKSAAIALKLQEKPLRVGKRAAAELGVGSHGNHAGFQDIPVTKICGNMSSNGKEDIMWSTLYHGPEFVLSKTTSSIHVGRSVGVH